MGTWQPDLSTAACWEDTGLFCSCPGTAIAPLSLPKKMGAPGTEGPLFKSDCFSFPGQRSRMCTRSCWRT